jgi:hypothetical protein
MTEPKVAYPVGLSTYPYRLVFSKKELVLMNANKEVIFLSRKKFLLNKPTMLEEALLAIEAAARKELQIKLSFVPDELLEPFSIWIS